MFRLFFSHFSVLFIIETILNICTVIIIIKSTKRKLFANSLVYKFLICVVQVKKKQTNYYIQEQNVFLNLFRKEEDFCFEFNLNWSIEQEIK
jgi:hypothetical protein